MVLVSASAAAWAAGPAGKITAIVGATVLHPELEGDAAIARDTTVLISSNRISAVGPAAQTACRAGRR